MSNGEAAFPNQRSQRAASPWSELWLKEDWWAIWLGLGIVALAYAMFASGSSLKWIAVTPPRWSTLSQITGHFADNAERYAAQFALWAVLFTIAVRTIGQDPRRFLASFAVLYGASMLIFALGSWDQASRYQLEPPLLALVAGLLVSNVIGLPRWLDTGFRVEFYVKTGIVLLGATLPFTLVVWAGPIAIFQASVVSIVTFLVIYWVGRRFGLDRRLCATLGAGGAVCGVSAAIAVAGAVGAKRDHAPIVITTVIVWAVAMIFILPLAARLLNLPTGVAGAWIGTSEFADAAGFAAAEAYGRMAGQVPGIAGTGDQAVWAFTLVKVVGRDVWIGIWAFALSIIAITRWEATEAGRTPDPAEIWRRFPKFVIGFAVSSLLITAVASGYAMAEFNKTVSPVLVSPIKDLRTWAFIFCFLSIGLTTRFRELAYSGTKPFLAFSAGVAVNVVLGFVLSAIVFAEHWSNLSR